MSPLVGPVNPPARRPLKRLHAQLAADLVVLEPLMQLDAKLGGVV